MLAKAVGISANAMQQRIRYAIQHNDLRAASRDPDTFSADDLGKWAVGKWLQHASAIAAVLGVTIKKRLEARISSQGTLCGRMSQAPGTIAECRSLIFDQDKRIDELERELAAARAQIDAWRPTIEAKERERDLKRKKSLGKGRPRKK